MGNNLIIIVYREGYPIGYVRSVSEDGEVSVTNIRHLANKYKNVVQVRGDIDLGSAYMSRKGLTMHLGI